MADSYALHTILEQIKTGQSLSPAELEIVLAAVRSQQVTLATGDRAIAVGGSAEGAIIVTGDQNMIVVVNADTAQALQREQNRVDSASTLPTLLNTHQKAEIRSFIRQSFPNKHFNGQFDTKKLERAAWDWLQPETKLESLKDLKRRAGCEAQDDQSFAQQLKDLCWRLSSDCPALEKWIWRRVSLLEYQLHPPTSWIRELVEINLRLRLSLSAVSLNLPSMPLTQALQTVDDIMTQALETAAVITCNILGSENNSYDLWTNLMIQLPYEPSTLSAFSSSPAQQTNYRNAEQLWCACHAYTDILMVVAKTGDATNQLGFWVPIARATNSTRDPLPGATTAFLRHNAVAVFVDDLPPLEGFAPELEVHWQNYMFHDFGGSVFISIPLVLGATDKRRLKKDVPAVLNVNARTLKPEDWRRAYHEQWLTVVQEQTSLFICEAYLAYQLRCDILEKMGKLKYAD